MLSLRDLFEDVFAGDAPRLYQNPIIRQIQAPLALIYWYFSRILAAFLVFADIKAVKVFLSGVLLLIHKARDVMFLQSVISPDPSPHNLTGSLGALA